MFLVNNSNLNSYQKLEKLFKLTYLLCKSKDTKLLRNVVLPNLIFIPIFVIHIWTLRKVIEKDKAELINAGMLWFNDLADADP